MESLVEAMQDITKIDKNFAVETQIDRPDIVWYDVSEEPFRIYGAYSVNPYLRMPTEVAERVNPGVLGNHHYTAGIRTRFRCNTKYIALHVEWDSRVNFAHMTGIGSSGFDLYFVKDGVYEFIKPFIPPHNSAKGNNGYEGVINVWGKMTDFLLNFPCYNSVKRLLIGVSADTEFEAAGEYRDLPPIVYYGSSITQGGCASRPGTTYQSIIARALNMDYINLGFSGSARGEREIAEYMATLDMSVFVSDYDHNSTVEELEANHYALYKTVREKHPEIPYVMITRPDYRYNVQEDVLRRNIVITSYEKALAEGDKYVRFIDGSKFFSQGEYWEHTVDHLHPNDLGFRKMAEGILPVLEEVIKEKYGNV